MDLILTYTGYFDRTSKKRLFKNFFYSGSQNSEIQFLIMSVIFEQFLLVKFSDGRPAAAQYENFHGPCMTMHGVGQVHMTIYGIAWDLRSDKKSNIAFMTTVFDDDFHWMTNMPKSTRLSHLTRIQNTRWSHGCVVDGRNVVTAIQGRVVPPVYGGECSACRIHSDVTEGRNCDVSSVASCVSDAS